MSHAFPPRGRSNRSPTIVVLGLLLGAVVTGCSHGSSGSSVPSIRIVHPTDGPTAYTVESGLRLGGTIAHASFVRVENRTTGAGADGFVFYVDGNGTWFADLGGLVPGDNEIAAIARDGGSGATAEARLRIARPALPALLMINGVDRATADTHWHDVNSLGHSIALFGDGTGRVTTGSTIDEPAGAVVDCSWSLSGPETIVVTGPANVSFARISRISGSFDTGQVTGQVVTVGGAGYTALDVFVLTTGAL